MARGVRTVAIVAAVLIPWSFASSAASVPAATGGPTVTTTSGPVAGVSEHGLAVFRGIPFAAPPTGANRFKAPQPVAPWSSPRDSSRYGAACAQVPDAIELAPSDPISEDCLTLNVWTPSTSGSAPVMVFIPGGGFVSGTTRNPWYDGAALASHGVTVVTIQYRVGPFGWLDLSSLGGDYAQSMNNGLLDQIAALRWVRENIARFGGDATNVTLFGESAGAISISALLGAPSADSLYDKVILESGTSGTVATRDWSTQVASKFEELAGVSSAQQVLSLSTQEVLDAAEKVYSSQFSDTAFHPVIDGQLVPAAPMARLSEPTGPSKPILMGTNLDEARYWYYYVPELARLPHSFYVPWLESLVGDRAGDVWQTYQQARPDLTDSEIGLAIAGDVGFRMPAIRMAEALSARGVPVRMYLATVKSIDLDGTMGSPHAIELPYVFGTLKAANTFAADDAAGQQLARQVQDLWTSFAATGTPTSAGVSWPVYDSAKRATLILDTGLTTQDDPYPTTRETWSTVTFDGTDPGLDRLTPLQYAGTSYYTPDVILSVYGWPTVLGALAAIVGVIVLLVWFVRRLVRRRRGRRTEALAAT
ncbi:MAG: carboxylesterase family protein [Candidatus Nanopelagicales bacterium]